MCTVLDCVWPYICAMGSEHMPDHVVACVRRSWCWWWLNQYKPRQWVQLLVHAWISTVRGVIVQHGSKLSRSTCVPVAVRDQQQGTVEAVEGTQRRCAVCCLPVDGRPGRADAARQLRVSHGMEQ